MGCANAVGTNIDIVARDKSMKFEVTPGSMRVGLRFGRPGNWRETKKEISDWEVRAA